MPTEDLTNRRNTIFCAIIMADRRHVQKSNMQSLPYSAKKILLSMRNLRDPFSYDAQRAISSFQNFVLNAPSEDINLEECSMFLSSSAKVFGLQIKAASKHMDSFANFIASTLKEDPPEKKKKPKDSEEKESKVLDDDDDRGDELMDSGPGPSENCDIANPVSTSAEAADAEKTSGLEAIECINTETPAVAMILEQQPESSTPPTEPGPSNPEESPTNENPEQIVNETVSAITAGNEASGSGSEQFTPIPIPTKSGEKRKEGPPKSENPAKRRRVEDVVAPTLTSVYDELAALNLDDDSDDDFPPILFPEVDLWNGTFDRNAYPDKPDKVPRKPKTVTQTPVETRLDADAPELPNQNPNEAIETPNEANKTLENAEAPTQSLAVPPVQQPEGNDVTEKPAQENAENTNAARTDSTETRALPDFGADDQQEIQNCINQLHYLPFTSELTTGELARSFHNTVEHLESIFQKYSLPFNRQLLKAASVVCANMVSTYSGKPVNGAPPYLDTVNSFREIFSETGDTTEGNSQSLVNSKKTIFERTKEKSVAESRATIQKRLEEMQRSIVPKYMQWPLIAENTPEFFHRVKQFEQKMKKILADEEKKETFDVSKYEIEVLAATSMECNEVEMMETDTLDGPNTSSRGSRTNSGEDPLDSRLHLDGMVSPLSNCDGTGIFDANRKWVPLRNVFHHMKKFDRNECARHFYAVLALLSSQNLDMNYDRHYSAESAKLVTKKQDHSQDDKYPRGLKIMNSRCPDADIEDIYVTALASKSVNENFRDLLSQEMKFQDLKHREEQGILDSPNKSFISDITEPEALPSKDDFVSTDCTSSFTGKLFGGRNNKK